MKVSGTVMLCAVAVCVVAFGMVSGETSSGRLSGFASCAEDSVDIIGAVESVGKTRKGLPAITLILPGEEYAGERTIVYMRDSALSGALPGDTLIMAVRVRRVENFVEGFDYVGYMARKRIHFICFQSGEPSLIRAERPDVRCRVKRARCFCIAALRRCLSPLKRENAALLLAFISGEKEDIRRDVLDDFRDSGTMHMLALSGLHVGIIYGILSFIFSILGNYPVSRKVRSAIVILCLWPYAALTGMGTSIFRAVVMATVYEMAVIFERERAPVNALAVSAVAVTFADPSAPSSVSFQLSFGAMFGMTLFYRTLSSLLPGNESSDTAALRTMSESESLPPGRGIPGGDWLGASGGGGSGYPPADRTGSLRRILWQSALWCGKVLLRWRRKIWNFCALSLSCQIITMPIVYAVFGTFAEWSLLANIICSPLVGAAMTMAPVCIILHSVPWVGDKVFLLLDRVLDVLRFCVEVMAS